MILTPRQRTTLDSLCRRIVPDAYSPRDGPGIDLAARVEERLANGDPTLARQVATLLSMFDHPFTGFLFYGTPRRFTNLSGAEQDARLASWEQSRLAIRRTIFQALRRLIVSTYYANPGTHAGIGFRGPFYNREPVVPWEGALLGTSNDDEPVARVASPQHTALNVERTPPDALSAAKFSSGLEGTTQGHEIERDTNISADVCVIGTGAGGAVAAARLAEAGYDVVMLEEGGYWTESNFTELEADMVPRLYADAGARATDDLSISILQGRSVGGSTTINWMITLRTPDWVLDEWEAEHSSEGMGPSDLAPVFDLIEEEIHARLVPDDAHSPSNRIILDGAQKLGWKASVAKINAKNCLRAGFCGLGCRYGAKQSTLVTYIPRALAAGARLYSDVRVEQIEQIERGAKAPKKRVHGTVLDRVTARPTRAFTVEAPIVVLAAGAVGTPIILQRSGLGGGGVGKYLRLHPTSVAVGVYDREIYAAAGIPQSAVCNEFHRGNGTDYGFWIESPALQPALASVAIPGFGAEHRALIERSPNLATLIVLIRDGVERGRSYGKVFLDRRGRTHIRYRMRKDDLNNMLEGLAAAARVQFAAGATEVRTLHSPMCRMRSEADLRLVKRGPHGPNQLGLFSAHVNGTCRIGIDPRTSGCTPDCERHGVPALYIADGSILPTAPAVNPQETIMALATIIAGRIKEQYSTVGGGR